LICFSAEKKAMFWQTTPYISPVILGALLSLGLAYFIWRQCLAPGAPTFALLMLAVAVWSIGYMMELMSADYAAVIFWDKIMFVGIIATPTLLLVFVIQYTDRERWLTRRNQILLAVIPALTLLLVWTNDLHHLFWFATWMDTSGPFATLDDVWGVWFWIHASYSYLLLILGTILLVQTIFRPGHMPHHRVQGFVLLIGLLVPWAGNALNLIGLTRLNLTSFAFSLTGLAVTVGLFRYRFLDFIPVAREALLESMGDGVIVLDKQNRIIDINPAAVAALGSMPKSRGLAAEQVFNKWPDLIQRYRDVMEAREELAIPMPTGETSGTEMVVRYLDLRISQIANTGIRLLVFRDITELRQTSQELRADQHYLTSLNEISLAAISTANPKKMLERMADRLRVLLNADSCCISLWDETQKQAIPAAVCGPLGDMFSALLKEPGGQSLLQSILNAGKTCEVKDVTNSPFFSSQAASFFAPSSLLGLPLIVGEQKLGAAFVAFQQPHPFTPDEIMRGEQAARQIALAEAKAELFERVQQLAITDGLTDISNRRHFFELADREFQRARRFSHPLTAVMLDVDHFKQINDTYGHAAGDRVLVNLAQCLTAGIRDVDILGRYGGDEFSILLPETKLAEARVGAERLRLAVAETPILVEGFSSFAISVSMGLAEMDTETADPAELIACADAALYAAKHAGRNRVSTFVGRKPHGLDASV
jgi:diguanylate cyclase (GGDEF)-like protein/PAS domain S-box-containing protein